MDNRNEFDRIVAEKDAEIGRLRKRIVHRQKEQPGWSIGYCLRCCRNLIQMRNLLRAVFTKQNGTRSNWKKPLLPFHAHAH